MTTRSSQLDSGSARAVPLPSGAWAPARWFSLRIDRFRPRQYASLPLDGQRVVDTLLWCSASIAACVAFMLPIYVAYGSVMGVTIMCFAALQPVLSVVLLRRGKTTAAVVVLAIWVTLVLDALILTNGGAQSTATHWLVILPCLVLVTLPAHHRLAALIGVTVHQCAILVVFWNVPIDEARYIGNAAVVIDTVVNVAVAAVIGMGIATTRREMLRRLARAENDVRAAMTPTLTGFYVVDREGRLAVDASDRVQNWLGGAREGDDAYERVREKSPALAEQFRAAFRALRDSEFNAQRSLARLPSAVTFGDRTYRVAYRLWAPAPDAAWMYLVATIHETTQELERELAALKRQATAVYVRALQRDHVSALDRFERLDALVQQIAIPQETALRDRLAALRDAAAADELHLFSRLVDQAIEAVDGVECEATHERMVNAWQQTSAVFDTLRRQHQQQPIRASLRDYNALLAMIDQRAPLRAIADHTLAWTQDCPSVPSPSACLPASRADT